MDAVEQTAVEERLRTPLEWALAQPPLKISLLDPPGHESWVATRVADGIIREACRRLGEVVLSRYSEPGTGIGLESHEGLVEHLSDPQADIVRSAAAMAWSWACERERLPRPAAESLLGRLLRVEDW